MTTTKKPVDVTKNVPKMRMHEFMSVPRQDVKFTLRGDELEFILATLTSVHTNLVSQLKDPKLTPEEHKLAYDSAYNTEIVYATLFRQLRLHKPERAELN